MQPRLSYNAKRIQDMVRALRARRRLKAHERWSRQELEQYQQQRLRALVGHALSKSPFYQACYAGVDPRSFDLQDLPVLTKQTVLDNFDNLVTDSRLKLSEIEAFVDGLTRDEYYLGGFRVVVTGGSSGLRGVFVYGRKEWATWIASSVRWSPGGSQSFLKRRRVSSVESGRLAHTSTVYANSIDIGYHQIQRIAATERFADIAARVNAFRPKALRAYSSVALLLAEEQLAGRLSIAPEIVTLVGEESTPEERERIERAWGVRPLDVYGMTEAGILGRECDQHLGIHASEDLCILEVVDQHNRPVEDGELGHKLLVTNLYNFTQPLIRYEVSDMVRMRKERCPCGLPFRLVTSIEGRLEDVIYLPGVDGGEVVVHPYQFRTLEFVDDVRRYQVVHDAGGLHIRIALADGAPADRAVRATEAWLTEKLEYLQAVRPPIDIEIVALEQLERSQMGKARLIRSDVARRGATDTKATSH